MWFPDGVRVKFNLTYSCVTDGAGNYWFIIDRFNADLNDAGLGNACQINPANGTWFCTTTRDTRSKREHREPRLVTVPEFCPHQPRAG